ncbi:MAG: DUF4292 domain-containing protein [Saprospiraceae bacterium]|jgi:hypothetical protein
MNNPRFRYPAGLAIALTAIIALASCSGTKNIGSDPRKDSAEFVWRKIDTHHFRANWFEGTAKISYDDGSQAVKASATLRMQQDSVVWIAIRKLGFEVARALLTTDSAFLIDRLNNEYRTYALADISSQYHLPANLRMIQQFLLGNAVFLSQRPEYLKNTNDTLTIQENNTYGTLHYNIPTTDYRPRQIAFKNKQGSQEMTMSLGGYDDTPDKQKFSYLRLLTLNGEETGKINVELKFSEVELNVPKSLPFEIPVRYLRVQ